MIAALAREAPAQGAGENDSRVLDLAHPQFSQRIEDDNPDAFEFVRLSIVQVNHPTRVGLMFNVAFVADTGSKVQLGGFSLYAPDNPGSFIVSTRHLIKSPGFIVVSLRTATAVNTGTPLSIKMGAITLGQGP